MIPSNVVLSEFRWFLLVILGFWLLNLPGALDGKYRPAATPMTLTQAVSYSPGQTRIWGTSAKLRDECEWRGFDWYLGERGGDKVPVHVDTLTSEIRKKGGFSFGPWILSVKLSDIRGTYADVLHRCYIKIRMGKGNRLRIPYPFLTRTAFWN